MSKSSASVSISMGFWLLCSSASLSAAVDMFLDLGPDIPGESTDKAHKDQVDVLAWSWGMSNSGTTHDGGGAGAGKANFQDLSLTKWVDKASPLLMRRCADGKLITKATLFLRKVGMTPIEYVKIELTNILVSSVSTGGYGGEDRLTENVTLNFAKVKFDYIPLKPDGSPGAAISFRWDIPGNSGTIIRQVDGLAATLFYTNGAPVARLTWISTAGARYQVRAASDLNAAFEIYGGPTASAGDTTTSIIVPADAIRKFFRIETLSSP